MAIKHFCYFVGGPPLIIWTDHAPLTHAIPAGRSCRLCQLQFISEFTSNIRHIEGEEEVVTDYLSRPPTVNAIFQELQSIDLQRTAQKQHTDPDIRNLQEDDNTFFKLIEQNLSDSGLTLLIDISRKAPRVVVPSALHKHAFDAVHSISHPSIRAFRKLIGQRFVWKGMNKDIANFAKACISCQQAKIHRHNTSPLQSCLQPDSRYSSIPCNFVRPLPECSGHAYLLPVIDRFSRHLDCTPLLGLLQLSRVHIRVRVPKLRVQVRVHQNSRSRVRVRVRVQMPRVQVRQN